MKLVSNAGRDMGELRHPLDDPRRCVQDGLETVELEPTGTEDAVTVVDPVADEAVREHDNRFLRERGESCAAGKTCRKDIAVRCGSPSAAHCPG